MELIESLETRQITGVHGVRIVVVGTTMYRHYKHGTIETEAVLVLRSTLAGTSNGKFQAQFSYAGGISHSGRMQHDFKLVNLSLPETISAGTVLTVQSEDSTYEVTVAFLAVS